MKRIQNKIGVIIATSLGRKELLFSRAIKSVLEQTYKPDYLLIVDDNKIEENCVEIEEGICQVRKTEAFTKIYYSRNLRTRGQSGTGAWNTGFDFYKSILDEADYVAILDDDDSWKPEYLELCSRCINNEQPDQIIGFIKRSDCPQANIFTPEDLCIESLLAGNPGIQGSNMFFRFSCIIKSGGFDESLASSTDRDFMLNILLKNKNHKASFLNKVLVDYFASPASVTYNPETKIPGLDTFYKKYIHYYSWDILNASLCRAEKLFKYPNGNNIRKLWKLVHENAITPKIVIGVAVHNNKGSIKRAIESILTQNKISKEIWIFLCDDDSCDDWKDEIRTYLESERIIYWRVNFHNVSKVRNFINDFIKTYFGKVSLIGRLDADDEYAAKDVLSRIEKVYEKTGADFIIAGNYLRQNNKILDKVNNPSSLLLEHSFLLNRLKEMAEGRAENELPSCNLFMTPENIRYYPDIKSAEDHFLVARILWNKENLKVVIAENLLLTIYSLNGSVTSENKTKNNYLCARKALYEEIKNYDR